MPFRYFSHPSTAGDSVLWRRINVLPNHNEIRAPAHPARGIHIWLLSR
jgi:hypothetical protein